MQIFFKDIKIFAFHGVYPEERILGAYFLLSIEFEIEKKFIYDNVSDTLNYVAVYDTLKMLMRKPFPLLENVALYLIEELKKKYPVISAILLKIEKVSPPIANFRGNVGIVVSRKF